MKANQTLNKIFEEHKAGKDIMPLLNKFAKKAVPIKNKRDESWETGAQNLFKAVVLSMLDSEKTAETFTVEKIKEVCAMGNFGDNRQETLLAYFKKQSLECRRLADAVLNNAPTTTKSYLGVLFNYLNRL